MASMFDTLLQLPLFQGISTESLTLILEKTKLHFEKKAAGEVIAKSGRSCESMIFILRGEVDKTTQQLGTHPYKVTEVLSAPYLVEPASLYGMKTTYRSTYIAESDVDIMSISKQAFNDILLKNEIFVLNYINLLCHRAKTAEIKLWLPPATNPLGVISEVILTHFETLSGRKSLCISLKKLSAMTHFSIARVKQLLNELEQKQLIHNENRCILIPDAAKLVFND